MLQNLPTFWNELHLAFLPLETHKPSRVRNIPTTFECLRHLTDFMDVVPSLYSPSGGNKYCLLLSLFIEGNCKCNSCCNEKFNIKNLLVCFDLYIEHQLCCTQFAMCYFHLSEQVFSFKSIVLNTGKYFLHVWDVFISNAFDKN